MLKNILDDINRKPETRNPKPETRNPKLKTLTPHLKTGLLRWAAGFSYCLFLDTCESGVDRYGQYEYILGVGGSDAAISSWDSLKQEKGKWLMGGLPYELKNRFEPSLQPTSLPGITFPEVAFFQPETVIYLLKGEETPRYEGKPPDWDRIHALAQEPAIPASQAAPVFSSNFSRQEYLSTVEKLRQHIEEGDCYEINLSQVFSAAYLLTDPVGLFQKLTRVSPVPFAAFFRFEDLYLLSASPERFLQHKDERLLTQPIKGTAPRGCTPEEDLAHQHSLRHSEKEQAENIMIVDLSRNDLYRSSLTNTVEVPHLFEVQTFPQVHQLVSTVTGIKIPELSPCEVLENTFPPGSMTGAPKVRTMKLIDHYEGVQRGLYAGSLGYLTPDGDFDFNVVIRSLVYDDKTQRLNYQVGGAITYDSDAAAEYEETLVKAKAIRELFT